MEYSAFTVLFCFNWRIIALQHCDGFCHTSVWISHRHPCVPSPPKSPPTSLPPHPSRLSQSAGSGCPGSHIKLALLSILHLVMYLFQYYSLISSYPLLLLLSPKVGSVCLCVLCCPAHDTISIQVNQAFSTCQLKSISLTTFDIWCSWKPELNPPHWLTSIAVMVETNLLLKDS